MIFIGIHSNQKKHFLACVRKEKNTFTVEHVSTLEPDVKPLYMLASFLKKKSFVIATAFSTKEILIRDFKYKLKSKRKIRSTLSFKIEPLLPFPPEEVILQPTFYPCQDDTEVFFIAGTKKGLQEHLEYWNAREIDPDVVSSVAVACFRFAQYFFPDQPSLIVYLLEEQQSTFIAISEGRIKLAQTFPLGRADFSQEIKSQKEIERILAFLAAKCPSIQHLLLVGEIEHTEEMIHNFFSSKFSILKLKDPFLGHYAPAIGIALDAAIQDKQSNQFRYGENCSKKSLKKKKRWFFAYSLGCFCALTVLFILGSLYNQKKKECF